MRLLRRAEDRARSISRGDFSVIEWAGGRWASTLAALSPPPVPSPSPSTPLQHAWVGSAATVTTALVGARAAARVAAERRSMRFGAATIGEVHHHGGVVRGERRAPIVAVTAMAK